MMQLVEAAAFINARVVGIDTTFTSVFSDSRAVVRGGLFVALRGERFDGHDFVAAVIAQGAVAAMVDEQWAAQHRGASLPLLVVGDTRSGLGHLAAVWRQRFSIPLIGVTGSNGKTTVKDMCASIMAAHVGEGGVLATSGNFNNEIGLPLTLLQLRARHRAAVIEMGMNHVGEISYLTRLASPTVAIVNNAQRAHLEGLGSIAAVARAKGEIFEGLDSTGVAVINADDPHVDIWRELLALRPVLRFGLDHPADVSASMRFAESSTRVSLRTPQGDADFELQLPGRHNVLNALAATAACLAAGAPLDAVVVGLSGYGGARGRLQRKRGERGAQLIDDTYNANPDSMRAAVDVLAKLPGKRLFVMGDMGEVGTSGAEFHAELGAYAKSQGIDRLFCLGSLSALAADNFGAGGEHFSTLEDLIQVVGEQLDAHTTVLVKGSRFMRMERVIDALLATKGKEMLLELARWLANDIRGFNVFNYITLRAMLATMTSLTISFVAGPAVIRWLAAKKIGQSVRSDGPQTHLVKAGTPTMGGALILISLGISTLLWSDLSNRFVWIVLIVTLGFGAVGWVDDWRKVVYRNPKGLSAKAKYFWQSVIGLTAAIYIAFSISAPNNEKVIELALQWIGSGFTLELPSKADLIVPFFKTVSYPLGMFGFIVLTYLVIVGSSNAVNLTDGLDGLAIMPTVMVGAALGIIAYLTGNVVYAKYLFIPHIPGAGELTVFCGAIAGAGLGFLWFNAYPAEVFMGDVGALALGAALGAVAVIVRQEILLFIMGGVFVAETVSVMVQVGWFKYTKKRYGEGRRILLMAPLHHHFEQSGWKETQVVVRFWIITILLVLFGLSTLKLR